MNTFEGTAEHIHPVLQRSSHRAFTRYLVPVGRVLFVVIFLAAVPMHFERSGIDYAASQGVPAAEILVPISAVLALLGGLSIALGYYARVGALLLILFLVPVTLMMHKFWGLADVHQAEMQRVMFLKNLSILGAALTFLHFGAGPVSLDQRATRKATATP